MTPAQYIAIKYPCRFAFETAHPRFGEYIDSSGVSLVLTVNTGYE